MKTYRGFSLYSGRTYQDWRVTFPSGNGKNNSARTRWGTLDEIRSDVDAYLSGTLPQHKRPSWA
jgi:hypothetical protein